MGFERIKLEHKVAHSWHTVNDEKKPVNFIIALVQILQETDAKMGFNVQEIY